MQITIDISNSSTSTRYNHGQMRGCLKQYCGLKRKKIGVKLLYWHMIYVFNRLGKKIYWQMMDDFLDHVLGQ